MKPDWKRIGQTMMLTGIFGAVCYALLMFLSFFVRAEESWGIFNLWRIDRLLLAMGLLAFFLFGGWLISGKSRPVEDRQ